MKNYSSKIAFTLAEVLITLGIIGIVAAITIPTLVTNISNRGYVERLFKTYSVLQNATNMIIAEEGDPAQWSWTDYYQNDGTNIDNERIVDLYRKKLKIIGECEPISDSIENECHVNPYDYKYLNGETGTSVTDHANYRLFHLNYQFILSDGAVIGLRFKESNVGVFWGQPDLLFTIDVNGKSGPNQIGRDVFWLYMKKDGHGKILPYTNEPFLDNGIDQRNTCESDKKGYSCAYRIFQERKMNY